MKRHGKIWHHIFIIPAAAAFIGVFGCAVMVLWNALLPRIAGLPPINFWEAAGLLILARILFGGLWGTGWHRGHKNIFREKWLHMNEDERKDFAARLQGFHHCHPGSPAEEDNPSGSNTDSKGREKE
jgi:hypothetical protein